MSSEQTVYGIPFNGYNIVETRATDTGSGASSGAASSDSGGLSSGAKAGIGVGVALGTIGVLAMVGALIILRRTRKQLQKPQSPPPVTTHTSPVNGAADANRSSQPYLPVPRQEDRHEVYGHGVRSPIEVQ